MRVTVTFSRLDKLLQYEDALRAVGLEPRREPTLAGVSGLLLTGGTDVDPHRYGEEPHPETEAPDLARDARELALLDQALRDGVPVFAICRGLQLLNVLRGGTLTQHLPLVELHRQKGVGEAHAVEVASGTRLAAIVGAGTHKVNSRHHQAIGRLGDGVRVSAVTSEVIEAVEVPGGPFAVAVQWHPEDRIASSAADRALFEAFAAAVGDRCA